MHDKVFDTHSLYSLYCLALLRAIRGSRGIIVKLCYYKLCCYMLFSCVMFWDVSEHVKETLSVYMDKLRLDIK